MGHPAFGNWRSCPSFIGDWSLCLKTRSEKCAKSVIREPGIKGEDTAKSVVELGEAEDVVGGLISESRCRDAGVSAVYGDACLCPVFLVHWLIVGHWRWPDTLLKTSMH